jgi:Uma2 family endonuclease
MAGRNDVKAAASAVKLTYDDFVLFPDDGKRHELINGEHYVTPSPNTKHQRVVGTLFGVIWTHLQANPLGEVFVAPFDVVMSDHDIVEPDVLYMSNARRSEVLTPVHVRGVPELVIEVASKGTRKRDETIKRRLYERMGVSEYWVVDPAVEVMRVYRHDGHGFGRPIALSREANDIVQTPLLPGFHLPVSRVFVS